ncbi:MAG: 4Fe-4S binding protein [Terriglobales bacterium]
MPTLVGPEIARPAGVTPKPKKKLARRLVPDHSQTLRRSFQAAFLLLNIWIGVSFYFWVVAFERGDSAAGVLTRPPGVEGWLPIMGLMNLKFLFITGTVPRIHPAAMFLIAAFLAISFLARKSFCSWLCPVGTLSEWLWRAGRRLFRRNFRLPRALDVPLRSLKYLLLAFFLWAVGGMSAEAIAGFLSSPYGLIADVKMLNFFRFLSTTAAVVLIVLALASLFIQNFWCRYLCPYGALVGLAALPSPLRIRRDAQACIDCAKCAKACPSALPVDKLVTIKSAECTGCMECVAVCPAEGALQMSPVLTKRRVPEWAVAALIAALFLGTVGYAQLTGKWATNLPDYVYRQLVPRASEAAHPMPGE